MLLKDKCVIVTGGSRGIGAGISRAMAQAGADVVINYFSENDAELGQTDGIEAVLADIEASGRRAQHAGPQSPGVPSAADFSNSSFLIFLVREASEV